jgi:Protein of unknown function (DUF4199)
MEERKPITHVTAGLIIAALLVVFSLIINFMGLTQQRALGLLQYALIIGGLIYFITQYGKANNYTLSFGNLFAYGFKATAVFTIINIVFLILFFLVFPEMKEKSMEIAREQMENNPNVSEEQIEQGIDIARRFFWVGLIGGTMFFMILVGAVGSLIGAAVTKKRPHNPLEQLSA